MPFQRAAEDRVAPVRDAADFHGRAGRWEVGHVAGEFSERALELERSGVVADMPLDDDLGVGRDFKIDGFAAHELHGLAPVRAHHVPLANPCADR